MAKPVFEIKKLECDPFDNRVTKRHISGGRITRQEWADHIAGLPDSANEGELIRVAIGEDSDGPARETSIG